MPFDPNISHTGTDRLSNIENGLVAAAAIADAALTGSNANTITQAAHGLVIGNWVRYNGSAYVKAEADVAADADVDGVVSAVVDANTFVIQVGGLCIILTGLTAGNDYFLSPTTAGALTATEPSTAGQISKPILKAVSTTSGWIENARGLVIPSKATITLPIVLIADGTTLVTGEDFASYTYEIGTDLNGYSLTSVVAVVKTVSSSGLPGFGIRKNSTEMLSTNVTIDANETSSRTAATAAVIKSDGSQTVASGDLIHFDCDVAGTGTKGCEMRLTFTAP